MTSRIGWAGAVVVLGMVAGCAGPSASPDAATLPDAAMAHDAATVRDTGAPPDAMPDAATLPDVGTVHDAGSDAFSATDTGRDAFAGHDANASVDVGVDAFCNLPPPPCAAPPAGCHYENPGCGTCGTLVCAPPDCSPACDVSHYCDHCGTALSCTTRPTPSVGICPDVFNPVCGCDGVTYSNSCELGNAMIPQWHTGACDGDVTTL